MKQSRITLIVLTVMLGLLWSFNFAGFASIDKAAWLAVNIIFILLGLIPAIILMIYSRGKSDIARVNKLHKQNTIFTIICYVCFGLALLFVLLVLIDNNDLRLALVIINMLIVGATFGASIYFTIETWKRISR